MRISNLKVKTPAIPSRTAANQFIDQHGYDMEWVRREGLYFVHDVQKDKLHVIHMSEVTNHTIATEDATAFMANLRAEEAQMQTYFGDFWVKFISLFTAVMGLIIKKREESEPAVEAPRPKGKKAKAAVSD